jgi:hypothetical protein
MNPAKDGFILSWFCENCVNTGSCERAIFDCMHATNSNKIPKRILLDFLFFIIKLKYKKLLTK